MRLGTMLPRGRRGVRYYNGLVSTASFPCSGQEAWLGIELPRTFFLRPFDSI